MRIPESGAFFHHMLVPARFALRTVIKGNDVDCIDVTLIIGRDDLNGIGVDVLILKYLRMLAYPTGCTAVLTYALFVIAAPTCRLDVVFHKLLPTCVAGRAGIAQIHVANEAVPVVADRLKGVYLPIIKIAFHVRVGARCRFGQRLTGAQKRHQDVQQPHHRVLCSPCRFHFLFPLFRDFPCSFA